MTESRQANYYPPAEERINIASHAIGLLLSIAGLILLIARALEYGNGWHLVSFSIYGISMIALYTASTAYHSVRDPVLRMNLRTADHASIYLLIAGTYTPFALVTLQGSVGWTVFGVSWGMAVTGIVLKLFFTGRFNLLSVLMYVLMGWMIIFFIQPLVANFPDTGLALLLAGGVAYTLGAVIYSFKKINFNHAIFHLFVLFGSVCHFLAVYYFVLPAT